ncbi:MAG: cation diffusion facilitator family transporter [Acidimicrobiales bacterium]
MEAHAGHEHDGHSDGGRPHGGHAHGHGASAGGDARYLAIALALIVGFMIGEAITAVISGSLALLADSGHMLSDAGALGASLWAASLAARPAAGAWSFGFKRAEILSAAGNGITLLIVSALVSFEAISRLIHPGAVGGLTVVITALVGIAVNVLAAWVLAKANRSSLNVEGSFQHIVTDLYGFIATGIAGVVLLVTGFARADAIASLVVVGLMLKASWGLLRASGRILLEAAPEGVDLDDVRAHLLETDHVVDVHDLHAWTVTSDLPALSAHVVVEDSCFSDGHAPQILDQVQACVAGHFDVEHSTFQLEPTGHLAHEEGTH